MGTPLDLDRFADDLARWAVAQAGPGSTVAHIGPMPGNAGLSFGFDLVADGAVEGRVIRLAPPGVRRRGNTDVLRQVPLLGALHRAGIPVAPVLWSTDDDSWFGTDVMVQPRVEARPLHTIDPTAGVQPADGDTAPYLRQAVEVLAEVHAVDWRAELATWDEPRSIATEVEFWLPILEKAPEPAWIEQGQELATALLETDPGGHRVGLFHGDYQTHNVLYRADGSLAAVVDWEIAGIGAVGLDLGWLAMMTDESCWYDGRREGMLVREDPHRLQGWYEDASGADLSHLAWYEALAAYRYGVIAALNLRLHRTGRRIDEVSVLMGEGVSHLFTRALELCASTSTTSSTTASATKGGAHVDHFV